MSTVTAPLERLRARVVPLTLSLIGLGLLGLLVVSVWLRTRGIHGRFWIDEGISTGISSHPFADIPGLLRQDGSPPLYYLLLHVWMKIVGSGEAETHALSLGFALLCIPTAFVLGRELFGTRAAWGSAALAATNPFLTYYAQETRMYALVAWLSMVVAGSFALAFVRRRRGWVPVFAVAQAGLLYAHNWGFFIAAGTVAALGICLWLGDDTRALLRDAALAYGGIALLFAAWVPTLLFQAGHTGAPWSDHPELNGLISGLVVVSGGPTTALALALVGGAGLVSLAAGWHGVGPAGPKGREAARDAAVLAAVLAVGLLVAWLASQVSPAWSHRYFAIFVGPLLLLAGGALTSAGRLGVVTLVVVALFWLHPRTVELNNKSDVHRVAVLMGDSLAPGDLIISTHPEQVPVLHYYLPDPTLRWATSMGPVRDPAVMDWRDALDRLKDARPKATLRALLRDTRRDTTIVLMQPILRTARWGAPWTALVKKRSLQWEKAMNSSPHLVRIGQVPHLSHQRLPRGVRAVLYRVTSPQEPASRAPGSN
jgi:mannosyltransferase